MNQFNINSPLTLEDIFGNGFSKPKSKVFDVFNYPLLVNKTICTGCGYVAKTYFEAELIISGDCANCEAMQYEAYEIQKDEYLSSVYQEEI